MLTILCVFLYICIKYTCIHEYMHTQIYVSFPHPLSSIDGASTGCWALLGAWRSLATHRVASFLYANPSPTAVLAPSFPPVMATLVTHISDCFPVWQLFINSSLYLSGYFP